MKKFKQLAAGILALLALCPAFTVSADLKSNERKDLTYSEMQYQKFDDSKLISASDELKDIASKNTSGKEKRIEELINIMFDEYDLQATMYNIRYNEFYCDVTNESIAKELPEIEEKYYGYYDVIFSALNKVYNSDYQDLMFELLDRDIITAITYYEKTDEKYSELSNEESKLVLEYERLSSLNYSVEYKGQSWTANDLYNNPPENYDEYNRISNMIYSKKNKELGEIYLKLVKIRDKIAKLYGYPNYAEYAYEAKYIRDYSLEDIDKIYEEVKKNFPNLYNKLYNQLSLSLYSTGLANQTYTGEEVLDSIEPYFADIDAEISENFKYMRQYHLYNIDALPNKMNAGYTVSLYSYAVPFIFNCPAGDFNDFRTMIHEFGHANADFMYPTRAVYEAFGNSLDTLEIHSQGMEALFIDYYDDIFGEKQGKAFTDYTIYSMTSSIIEGCLFDEFQRYAYENPECTLDQLNSKYMELYNEYGLNYSTDVAYSYDWTEITHNFNSPMYYISYATSALSSLDLWIEAANDRDNAINTYKSLIACSSDTPYIESIESCGLRNIFESGVVSDIAEETEIVLKNGTIKLNENESSYEVTEPSEVTEATSTFTSASIEKSKAKTNGMTIPMLFSLIVIAFILAILVMVIILITSLMNHRKNKKSK